MAGLGTVLVAGFALHDSGGSFHRADLALLCAVLLAALGYAEGGRLAQSLGGEQVICWALILSLPVLLPATGWLSWHDAQRIAHAGARAWTGFAYAAVLLREALSWSNVLFALAVIAVVAAGRRMRVKRQ